MPDNIFPFDIDKKNGKEKCCLKYHHPYTWDFQPRMTKYLHGVIFVHEYKNADHQQIHTIDYKSEDENIARWENTIQPYY